MIFLLISESSSILILIIIMKRLLSFSVCWLMLTILCSASSASRSGIYFVQKNKIYTSYSTWLLTFTYDLAGYQNQIANVKREVLKFKEAHQSLKITARDINDSAFSNLSLSLRDDIHYLLGRESAQFEFELKRIQSIYDNLYHLTSKHSNSRSRRSLFPFVGNLLSSLFGTPSKANLKELKLNLMGMSESNNKVIHAVSESISLINQTHKTIKQNRKVINQLIQASTVLETEISSLYSRLFEVTEPEILYTQMVSRIHDISHIVSSALRSTYSHISELSDQIRHSTQGTLSTFIVKPSELEILLRKIKKKLPKDLDIPYPLRAEGLIDYYRFLPTLLLPDDHNRFHILTVLPLVRNEMYYNIFEVIAVPVPKPNLTMSASYDVESKFLAISMNENFYIPLSDLEAYSCLNSPYCKIISPTYSVRYAPNCLTSLFKSDTTSIEKLCKRKLSRNSDIPLLYNLLKNRWIISLSAPLTLNYVCDEQRKEVLLDIGVHVVTVPEDCSLDTKYFKLDTYIYGNTLLEEQADFEKMPSIPDVWPITFSKIGPNHLELNLTMLSQISDLPVEHVAALLTSAEQNVITKLDPEPVNTINIAFIIILVLTLSTMIFYILYKYYSEKHADPTLQPEAPPVQPEPLVQPEHPVQLPGVIPVEQEVIMCPQ